MFAPAGVDMAPSAPRVRTDEFEPGLAASLGTRDEDVIDSMFDSGEEETGMPRCCHAEALLLC